MKSTNKWLLALIMIACVFFVLVLLFYILLPVGCVSLLSYYSNRAEYIHEFRQPKQNIDKVEICTIDNYDYINRETLKVLTEEEAEDILKEISTVIEKNYGPPPATTFGDYVILISYSNGEVELIGSLRIGYVSPDGKMKITTYGFGYERISNIISKYYDISSTTTVTTQ